jgi:hypothetical protein
VIVAIALAVSTALAFAQQKPKQAQCPTRDSDGIVDLIRQAPSCARGVALFEICQFGSSGDVGLGAAVTAKCEGDFLQKLSAVQKADYERRQKQCARKYQQQAGSMYRSFEAFCAAYVARDYSARFLKTRRDIRKR